MAHSIIRMPAALRPEGGIVIVRPSKFEVSVEVHGEEGHIAVEGDLDMATAPRLEGAVRDAAQSGARKVTIDLGSVSFVDSSGLRVLILIDRQAQEDGWELAIRRPSEGAFTVFKVSGADESLPFIAG